MDKVCRRALIEGRVQRVWFRDSTQKQALKRNITGWAKNLPDGRVEVLMCGTEEALDQLQTWLHKGPTMAKVSRVDVMDEPWQWLSDFMTG